jgi:hypothetical protein
LILPQKLPEGIRANVRYQVPDMYNVAMGREFKEMNDEEREQLGKESIFKFGVYAIAVVASTAVLGYGLHKWAATEIQCLPVALGFAVIYGGILKTGFNANVIKWLNYSTLVFPREQHPVEYGYKNKK